MTNSRFAFGSGGRLGGVRRRGAFCLRGGGRRSGLGSTFASGFAASVSAFACVADAGRLRPRPPRLPRLRRFFVLGVSVAPGSAGVGVTGSVGGAGAGALDWAARSLDDGLRRRNNRNK